jgi:hypothetical protein
MTTTFSRDGVTYTKHTQVFEDRITEVVLEQTKQEHDEPLEPEGE